MNYEEHLTKDARLTILKELALQTDGRLNHNILHVVLDKFGHNRTKDWLKTQLRVMGELGAVTILEEGTVIIATLTQLGTDHLERRTIIEGVARPSPGA